YFAPGCSRSLTHKSGVEGVVLPLTVSVIIATAPRKAIYVSRCEIFSLPAHSSHYPCLGRRQNPFHGSDEITRTERLDSEVCSGQLFLIRFQEGENRRLGVFPKPLDH